MKKRKPPFRKKRGAAKRQLICAVFIIAAVISCSCTLFDMRRSSSPSGILDIAYSQVGNAGGKKYWKWYGFDNHVDWCACFVSWCLYKSGRDQPKFAVCDDGIEWFKSAGKWESKEWEAKPGAVIFFDCNEDGISDHTGIVKKCEGGKVYTIEGNVDDKCIEKIYDSEDESIIGYGFI